VVLDRTIGIAVVMVALWDTFSASDLVGKYQLGFSHMCGVAAYQGNNTEDLGKKKQSDEPRTDPSDALRQSASFGA
jgi:hypothetical protein